MILPIQSRNAREAAHCAAMSTVAIAPRQMAANTRLMAPGQTRVRACNRIFRYPSPCGCSDCVPLGTPVFYAVSRVSAASRRCAAQNPCQRLFRFSRTAKQAICQPEANSGRKGKSPCANTQLPCFAASRSLGWRPAGTRSKSRRSSGRVPGLRQPPLWAAAGWPVPLSAARPTSSTARKTPASVTDPLSRAAFARPNRTHETIVPFAGVGGFFVSKTPRIASGQEPEGT